MLNIDAAGFALVNGRTTQEVVLLASAERSAVTNTAVQFNDSGRGLVVFLDVSAVSGTGGLHPRLMMVDFLSGNTALMTANPAVAATVGRFIYTWYPGVSGALGMQMQNLVLPRSWYVTVQHDDASNYTYSLSACVIA